MAHWWETNPWRMVQTNFREIDMADVDAGRFVDDLLDLNATIVTLNAGGIIASYETQLPIQPRSDYLQGDSLLKLVNKCHEAGIKVIARMDFSKVRLALHEQHPEWAYLDKDKKIINYNGYVNTCPNGNYQQKHIFEILQEVFTTHPFDGLFLNMSGFLAIDYNGVYHGPCHCENCRQKFYSQFGAELPQKDDFQDPVYKKYALFKQSVIKDLNDRIYQLVKEINPEIAVNGYDYWRTESNTDINRPPWVYSAASNSRVVSGARHDRPSDNANVDFMGSRYRDISVSPALIELRHWQNLANSGCLSYFIMGRLDNHADQSSFEPTRKVFQFHKDHQEQLTGLVSAARVVVMRKDIWPNDQEINGWIRALTESHLPFDEMLLADLLGLDSLSGKDVVILGELKLLSTRQAAIFDAFAQAGGTIVATGEPGLAATNSEISDRPALACLGIRTVREVRRNLMSSMFMIGDEEKDLFPHCRLTPYIAPGASLVLADFAETVKKHLKLVPEHPFGPPEICYFSEFSQEPGVTVNPYGQGYGLYIPWLAGTFYSQIGSQNTLSFMQDILFSICGLPDMAPDLSPMVSVNIDRKGDQTIIQLVNNSGCFANSYFPPLPVQKIRLILEGFTSPVHISTLRGAQVLWQQADGKLQIELDVLKDYEAVLISDSLIQNASK
ncbi:MAG TPA: hypothetical protein DCM45_07445 [Clostridiales bacterium]|nr:hypothetical protein [Clostridiales bacterium]